MPATSCFTIQNIHIYTTRISFIGFCRLFAHLSSVNVSVYVKLCAFLYGMQKWIDDDEEEKSINEMTDQYGNSMMVAAVATRLYRSSHMLVWSSIAPTKRKTIFSWIRWIICEHIQRARERVRDKQPNSTYVCVTVILRIRIKRRIKPNAHAHTLSLTRIRSNLNIWAPHVTDMGRDVFPPSRMCNAQHTIQFG